MSPRTLGSLLSSGYVANLTAEEWVQMEAFDASGQPPSPGPLAAAWEQPPPGAPFAPEPLFEAFARFWDMHTRSPVRILVEEGMPEKEARRFEMTDPATGVSAYSGAAYDLVMSRGAASDRYVRPFLWALERAGGDSPSTQLIFPIAAFAALGSPRPVQPFAGALGQRDHRAGSGRRRAVAARPPVKQAPGPAPCAPW